MSKKHAVQPNDLPPNIKDISFGETHALAATTSGELYSWGNSKWGQVGLGAKASLSSRPRRVTAALDGKVVVQTSCGASHSAVLTDTGDVYTWGRGFEGQTGHASKALDDATNDIITSVQLLPKCVSSFTKDPVAALSCGYNFTCVVTRAGGVWSWGEGGSGQLGFGRITKQSVPKIVLPCCPTTSQPFVDISCGWGHTLALTSGGELYAWGLNTYGQLGLGDTKARQEPARVTEDAEEGGASALRFSKITASTNYSLAIDFQECLYSFGCNSSSQLGHPDNSHRFVPTFVEGLKSKRVSLVTSTGGKTYAFTPTAIYSVDPPLGPISGGSKVMFNGGGFWDSENIVVRFMPQTTSKKAVTRAAVGEFSYDEETGKQYVMVKTPRFAMTGPVTVEISMNGTDFTKDKSEFTYFADPSVGKVTPTFCNKAVPELIEVDGTNYFESPLLKVRFKGKSSKGQLIVPAKFKSVVVGTEVSEETEEEVEVYRNFVVCKSPPVSTDLISDDKLPWETRVAVALNGIDFKTTDKTFIFHDFTPDALFPSCAPFTGNCCVQVKGKSFFDSGKLIAKFSWPWMTEVEDEEGHLVEVSEPQIILLPAVFVDKNTLNVDVYSLLGEQNGVVNLLEGGSDLKFDEESDFLDCLVEISMDGGETYTGNKLGFRYYNEPEFGMEQEKSGPMSGETAVHFTSSSAGCGVSNEAVVKFFTEDGLFESFVDAECKEELGEDGESIGVLQLSCLSPEFVLKEVEREDDEEGEEEGKSAEEEKGGEEEDVEEDAEDNEEPEEKEDAGDEDVDEDAPVVVPTKKADITKVLCMVAFNGVNFGEVCGSFDYYPTPVITKLSSDTVSAGSALTVEGENFFSGKVWVRFDNRCGVNTVVEGNVTSSGDVSVTVPMLLEEEENGEGEDGAKSEDGGEEKKSVEEEELVEGEDGEVVAKKKAELQFAVSVSFNETNFSVQEELAEVEWIFKGSAEEEEEEEEEA